MKDYFGFQGKNVVVTGASSGMGEVAAKMLVDLARKFMPAAVETGAGSPMVQQRNIIMIFLKRRRWMR